MPRKATSIRGIVLAGVFATALLAACTPPMPPDVLAAKAESQITCQAGEVQVAVPEAFTGAMSAVGMALGGVCPEQLVTEVAIDQPAPVAVVDGTPAAADIAAWGKVNCPAGTPIVTPVFGYPVTIAYNVIGLEGVVMTPQIVAGILDGSITSWEDPAIVEANAGFDFTGLPAMTLMGLEGDSGSVQAMTSWLTKEAPDAWTSGIVTQLDGAQTFPTTMDLVAEMTAVESSVAVLPVFTSFNNMLATANLPVTLEDGSELVITADDVQMYKVGSGATTITKDATGSIFASPAVGGVPTEGNFDVASSKIVLAEGQPLVGWPVVGYAHLMVCDSPADPLPVAFAQYAMRLAGQGSLETFGLTPLPEPIRVQTFTPLKVTVATEAPTDPAATDPAPSAS